MRDADRPPRRFLWAVSPVRAIVESWLWGLAVLVFLRQLAASAIPAAMGNGWFVLAGLSGTWAVLRARLPAGPRPRRLLWELGTGLGLSLAMAAGIMAPIYLLHWPGTWQAAYRDVSTPIVLLLGIGPGFAVARGLVHLWRFWDQLRRRRMLWSLAHAHLVVVAIVVSLAAIVALLLSPLGAMLGPDPQAGSLWAALASDLLVTFFPAAMAVLLVLVVLLSLVLPPSALLSFLVARKTTRRLEDLARATGALRDGDYGTRVVVSGEDEVARLQSNFNAMAAALQTMLHDVETERDKVAHLMRARQALVASVSHELRTPVATLRAYLESMRARDDAGPAPDPELAAMESEVLHLQRMLDDLFTLARAEVEALTLDPQPVVLAPVVQRRIAALGPLAWQREYTEIAAEIPPDLPPVYVDRDRLDQILTNLLRNALRHTPPGGIVVVRARPDGDLVRLDVCDTGQGIAPVDLPHVWERFYRGEEARALDRHGAGLGLALVKELTEAMGGTVDVQSVPGEGSCFSVWLPKST